MDFTDIFIVSHFGSEIEDACEMIGIECEPCDDPLGEFDHCFKVAGLGNSLTFPSTIHDLHLELGQANGRLPMHEDEVSEAYIDNHMRSRFNERTKQLRLEIWL